jgi:general secretion pathway protein H
MAKIANPAATDTTKTSVRKISIDLNRQHSQTGFTLIEIMIVIAIITGVLAVGSSKLFSSATDMRGSVRKIAILTREVRNNSRLFNVTTRLVINMPVDKKHSYAVESTPGTATLLSEDQRKDLDRLTTEQRKDEEKKSDFTPEKRILKKPQELPKGMFFESVEIVGRKDPITSGVVYINFFPQGLAQEALIHLTNRKLLNWTIAINPLTGHADVYERKLTMKDIGK